MSALPPEVRPETGPKKELAPQFRRSLVDYHTKEPVGTIIVDTPNTYLYLVLGNGKALRYGIGVGREGFTWTGAERVSRMAEWPDWNPPEQMIERQPYLPRFMAGGDGNPLGARALYLGQSSTAFTAPISPPLLEPSYPPDVFVYQRGHHGSLHTSEGRHSGSRAAEQAGRFAHRSYGGYPVWADRHAEEEIQT